MSVDKINIVIDESVPPGTIRLSDGGVMVDIDVEIPTTVKHAPGERIEHCRGTIACPACDCRMFRHVRGKLYCEECHRTLETCCD